MAATHDRNGHQELLGSNVARTPEHDGIVTSVLIEMYAQRARLDDYRARSGERDELDAFHTWLGECEVTAVLDGGGPPLALLRGPPQSKAVVPPPISPLQAARSI
jgi:hypothetical protein